MAAGFTPKHVEQIELKDLSAEDFLVLATETIQKLGWELTYLSKSGLLAYTNNGMFSWNADLKLKLENGQAMIQSASTGSEVIDWGRNKKNVTLFRETLEELRTSLKGQDLSSNYLALKERMVDGEEDRLLLPPPTVKEGIGNFFSIFIPGEGFTITPLLLDINILYFIIMVAAGVGFFNPDSESLVTWGANFKPVTLEGQWWRLISANFIHIGIIHLVMNMYALIYIGVLLEPLLGRVRFASAYLLCGVTAAVTSLWWHNNVVSAGASGAIFGMYGVFLALLTTNLIEKAARKSLLASISVFVAYNLVFGLKSGIDNAAHIGGLVGGILLGYGMIPSLRQAENRSIKVSTIVVSSLLVIGSSLFVYQKLPNDLKKYDSLMNDFVSSERLALEVYSLPSNTPTEKILYNIKDRGLYYWNECLTILKSCEELDLPLELRHRNKKIKEYCELRIKYYELLYKSISENSDQYNPQLEEYDQLLQAKINELNPEK